MKRIFITVTAICLLTSTVFLILLRFYLIRNEDTQIIGKGSIENTVNVFLINDSAYYLNGQADLFYIDNSGKATVVNTFPTDSIICSDEQASFLYFGDDAGILSYEPISGTEEPVINLNDKVDSKSSQNRIICAIGNYIFIASGHNIYKANITNDDVEAAPQILQNMLTVCEKGIICQSDDYNSLIFYNPFSNEQQILISEESNAPVITACAFDDVVFYARADGKLKKCVINNVDTSGNCYEPMLKATEKEEIIGIAKSGNNMVCVVAERNGSETLTSAILIKQDGTKSILSEMNAISYTVPGSCIVKANENVFEYGITTDNRVVYGSVKYE